MSRSVSRSYHSRARLDGACTGLEGKGGHLRSLMTATANHMAKEQIRLPETADKRAQRHSQLLKQVPTTELPVLALATCMLESVGRVGTPWERSSGEILGRDLWEN